MVVISRLSLAVGLTLLLAVLAHGQRSCFNCNSTGFLPCKSGECKRTQCKFDLGEHRCVRVLSLECCRGIRKTPCTQCTRGTEEFEYDVESRLAWLAERERRNKDMKLDGDMIQTTNFRILFDIEKVKVKDVTYDKNNAMHLYASRFEELYRDWTKLFGDPYRHPQTGTWELWMLNNGPDRDRVRRTLIGGAASQYGAQTSMHITGNDRATFKDDEALHASVYHMGSHLITQQGHNVAKTHYPGWLTEGIAHWMENTKFDGIHNRCTGEVGGRDRWIANKFEGLVLPQVRKQKEPHFSTYNQLGTKELSPMLQAFSWSVVDYLMANHRAKVGDIVRSVTGGKTTAEALTEHLGWSVAKLHDEWRTYVEKAYAGK